MDTSNERAHLILIYGEWTRIAVGYAYISDQNANSGSDAFLNLVTNYTRAHAHDSFGHVELPVNCREQRRLSRSLGYDESINASGSPTE